MYLSVPLITLYLIFIGHLLTLLCGFSGPFISPLIGSREGSGARASDEIRVCVVFNFQPCKFHALFAVCPAGTGGRFPPGEAAGPPTTCSAAGSRRLRGRRSRDGQAWLAPEDGSLLLSLSPGRLRAGAVAPQACGNRGGLRGWARQAPDCSHCASAALACATARGALCYGDLGLWHLLSLQHPAHGYLVTEPCLGHPPHRAQPWVLTLPRLWAEGPCGTWHSLTAVQ